jgi:hypothetical protein
VYVQRETWKANKADEHQPKEVNGIELPSFVGVPEDLFLHRRRSRIVANEKFTAALL